jgi:hypothetical protein
MMKIAMLLFIISTLALPAYAVQPRCGNDAFGNVVCMDKNGVLSTRTIKPKSKLQNKKFESKSETSSRTEEKVTKESGNTDDTKAERCGTDPFGNTVCR